MKYINKNFSIERVKAKNLVKWNPKYRSDDLINDMIKYEKDLYE